jgi:hypothetical protein
MKSPSLPELIPSSSSSATADDEEEWLFPPQPEDNVEDEELKRHVAYTDLKAKEVKVPPPASTGDSKEGEASPPLTLVTPAVKRDQQQQQQRSEIAAAFAKSASARHISLNQISAMFKSQEQRKRHIAQQAPPSFPCVDCKNKGPDMCDCMLARTLQFQEDQQTAALAQSRRDELKRNGPAAGFKRVDCVERKASSA